MLEDGEGAGEGGGGTGYDSIDYVAMSIFFAVYRSSLIVRALKLVN